jgi:hypothetical protein
MDDRYNKISLEDQLEAVKKAGGVFPKCYPGQKRKPYKLLIS